MWDSAPSTSIEAAGHSDDRMPHEGERSFILSVVQPVNAIVGVLIEYGRELSSAAR